ncbi:MAG: NAD(P)-dependent oxidoreductase [Gammaproteobacteria bacterium]|nr:NAD(P)-dependent oxidoreductase [Gammaproteobacteria bacterium]MDH3450691.1 NAD(P)-dependent oxidoreductase [Gammaproteobacteria bacterium]
MARVAVVTGANGWLGKTLIGFLSEGHPHHPDLTASPYDEIRCLVLQNEDAGFLEAISGKVRIFHGDITSRKSLSDLFATDREFDLYHTAGIVHPRNVRQFYEVNHAGAVNVLNEACDKKIRKVVFVSSNSPLGCNPFPDHLFDEDSPYHPYMNYGKSKMKMELSVKGLATTNRVNLTLIRCPWFYGPNQPPRQTVFFSMIKDGRMPVVGDGSNMRSMSYLDNLCQGIMLAGRKTELARDVYWIADENPYSMNDIVDTVESLLEQDFGFAVQHRRLRLPWLAGEIATLCDWSIQKLGFYHQKMHVLSEMNKTIACSIDRAVRELDYRPQIALREGMKRSIQWCLDNNQAI